MKAKEYFEKYFSTHIDENGAIIRPENLVQTISAFTSEMVDETIELCRSRHSGSVLCFEGALREMNQKFNAVADICEKKFGTPILKRNGFLAHTRKTLITAGIFDPEREEHLKTLRGSRK